MNTWIIHFDGGIRGGNPGGVPTYGVQITDGNGIVLHSMNGIIKTDHPTNNVAEWTALKHGLVIAWANRDAFQELVIIGDSELVVKQLSGEYSVNAEHLKPIHKLCQNILRQLQLHHVRTEWNGRDNNSEADELAGKAHELYMMTGG